MTLLVAGAAAAQFVQQGPKLVGTGASGPAWQGGGAISADGNTVIVGGPFDNLMQVNAGVGAVWVFTRSGGVWSQQGAKLVGAGAVPPANMGASEAISADGNTAIVGGNLDNSSVGAVWAFTRSGGVWSQQGGKLVGTGAVGPFAASQGTSVGVSADGNTAIVGGYGDNHFLGAAWVFTRSGGAWSQQGNKLVGADAIAQASQGVSVAISADGNTAIVGGPGDSGIGAAWVYTRSGGLWSQQGSKLVGTGVAGPYPTAQGVSVALSADGNTAVVGGVNDNGYAGAAWVFTRSEGVWLQQGGKLVGTGAVRPASQGASVAISGDGNTVIVGGPGGNPPETYPSAGAAWVFTRSGGAWSQQGNKLVGTGAGGPASQGAVSISADGTTVVVGGPTDDSGTGATWIFAASAYGAWVPVASHNPGKNDSQWRSDLGLLNTGTVAANAQITFHGGDRLATSTTFVPAGAQSMLTDVVGQLGGSGSGALEIVSDQSLKVTARTYNQIGPGATCYPGGTQGQDYPALANGGALAAGQNAHLAGLVENGSYRSNIGVVNVGSDPATVLVELYDGAGGKLGDYTVALAAGQWSQATQPFFNTAGQTGMDRGYAKITVQSGSGVFAFASVIDNLTNDPTTVSMQR